MSFITRNYKIGNSGEVVIDDGGTERTLDDMFDNDWKLVSLQPNRYNASPPWLGQAILETGVDTWNENAKTALATAGTVTRTGEASKRHEITSIFVGYDASQIGELTIDDGATTICTLPIHDTENISFDDPIEASEGNDLSVTISAGGTGVTGYINVFGITR